MANRTSLNVGIISGYLIIGAVIATVWMAQKRIRS